MKKYGETIATPEAIWFASVPNGWRATKMRELFSERNVKVSDKDYEPLSVGKMGVVPQLETAVKTDNGDNRKLICTGDFAINSRSDRKGSCGISEYDGSCSLIITVLKPHNALNGRFYHYLLRSHYFSEEFYRNGKGLVSDLWTTKWDEMRNIYIPVPPRPEQDQIVRFLDYKTAKIDKLIGGYKQQIELLEERKRKIEDSAIIDGINPKAEYKETTAEWMGKVPKHWQEMRTKNFFSEINIRSENGDEPHLTMSQKFGLVTDDEYTQKRLLSEDYKGAKLCWKDDIVLNRLKAHLGVFALSPILGVVSPDYTVIRINQQYIVPEYALKLFRCQSFRSELTTRVRGIVEGFWRLYTEDLGAIRVCIPSVEEQKQILQYVKEKETKINQAITGINKQITLLQEYRTRLISDVVTGQVDVRDIPIPETEVN